MHVKSRSDIKVLMVTRESQADRLYGLGKSLNPLVAGFKSLSIPTIYLAKEEAQNISLPRGLSWGMTLLGKMARGLQSPLLFAFEERLRVGIASAKVAHSRGTTHVQLHDPWLAIGFLLGQAFQGSRRTLWGVTQHGFGSYANATRMDGLSQSRWVNQFLNGLERVLLLRADWVVVPTALGMNQLLEDLHLLKPPNAWVVIPHPRPEPLRLSRSEAREILEIPDSRTLILAVGRIVPLKGFEKIMEALAALLPENNALELVILGGDDVEALWRFGEELRILPHLKILCVEDVSTYLSAADLYVSASTTESFGLANLEAQSAGLPCVCTSVGGVPEVLGAGALLFDPETSNLAEILRPLVLNPDQRRPWIQKGLENARKWPTRDDIVQKYVDLFEAARQD